ncbi:MAG: hypothetical protein H6809_06830 [Phycisphaeraceae bacterium]|nr:hypothetical protein [Phycisphaeraceae bacterium]
MPPLTRMVVPALEDLARQLRFAPREALLRDIERAESLAGEVLATSTYDEAWIIARVTGYEAKLESPAIILGNALLADLSAFVERLSDAARLGEADLPEGWLDTEALAARWSVSRKTLDRYRKRGLVARRVIGGDAKVRLAFTPDIVEAFEARQGRTIAKARKFTRIPPEIEASIVRRAGRYRSRFGCSLNEAAARLATRFDRSHEAVRQVLQRHDQARPKAARIFDAPGPPDERFERLAWRAWRRALDPGLLARRSKRSRVSVVRCINRRRTALLQGVEVTPFGARVKVDAADRVLEAEPCRTGLDVRPVLDALEWARQAPRTPAPVGIEERLRAQAYHLLVRRAADLAAGLDPAKPDAQPIDLAETSLRWASRLKAALVLSQQGLIARAIESRLGRPLDQVRGADLAALVVLACRGVGEGIDAYDPFSAAGKVAGRLAAPAGLAIDRAVVRWLKQHARPDDARPRATPRLTGGTPIADWSLSLCAWQAWTEPDPRVRAGAAMMGEAERAFLLRRFGWDGGPPATRDDLVRPFGLTRITVVTRERKLVREAVERSRAMHVVPGRS